VLGDKTNFQKPRFSTRERGFCIVTVYFVFGKICFIRPEEKMEVQLVIVSDCGTGYCEGCKKTLCFGTKAVKCPGCGTAVLVVLCHDFYNLLKCDDVSDAEMEASFRYLEHVVNRKC
jgi:hypothetical protein